MLRSGPVLHSGFIRNKKTGAAALISALCTPVGIVTPATENCARLSALAKSGTQPLDENRQQISRPRDKERDFMT